jgi:hypothetical protein
MKRVYSSPRPRDIQVRESPKAARAWILNWKQQPTAAAFEPLGTMMRPGSIRRIRTGYRTSLARRGPFDGILAVGDRPACVRQAAEFLGPLSPRAARTAGQQASDARVFSATAVSCPEFRICSSASPNRYSLSLRAETAGRIGQPGVIRANNAEEFRQAADASPAFVLGDILVSRRLHSCREFASKAW